MHPVFRELRYLLDSYSPERPRMAMGKVHIFDPQAWVSYYGVEVDELHLPFNFGLLGVAWKAQTVRQAVDGLAAILPAGAWSNYVLGNHDESRTVSRIGAAQARVALLLLLTLRGTPTLYYGDEIGMHDVNMPPEQAHDP